MAALWGNIKLGCFIWRTVVHCEQLWRSIELLGNERQRPALIYSVMFFWLLWLIWLCRAGEVAPSLCWNSLLKPRLERKIRNGEPRYKSQAIWIRLLNPDKPCSCFMPPGIHYTPWGPSLSGFMLKSCSDIRRPSWKGHGGQPSNEVLVMCRCWSGWNQTQYTTLLCGSKSSHSHATHKQVRGALSLHNNTHSCDHLIFSGSDSFLCTFPSHRKC